MIGSKVEPYNYITLGLVFSQNSFISKQFFYENIKLKCWKLS
jgi:hypothetical protein